MYAYKRDNDDVFVQSENNPNIENWTWINEQHIYELATAPR